MKKTSSFPERLRELRTEKGLSAVKLGKQSGISFSIICAWEKGQFTPKLDSVEKLAEFFGVSLNYLAGWDE